MFNFNEQNNFENFEIKRKWNEVRVAKGIQELDKFTKEDIDAPINIDFDKRMYRMQWFNLFVFAAFLLQGLILKDATSIIISLTYEILFAPFRSLLDAIFCSYKRIIAVCTYIEEKPGNSKQIAKTQIHIAWKGRNSNDIFSLEETNQIHVGDVVSVIKGRFSRKIICVERQNVNMTN